MKNTLENLENTRGNTLLTSDIDAIEPLKTDEMEAFLHTSWIKSIPSTKFGTGSRPPLHNPSEGGPGPGAYQIKSTLGKSIESENPTPCQFTLKGRTKFGDLNEKILSKNNINDPGPGHYDLDGKFLSGTNPRKSSFPKSADIRSRNPINLNQVPGPGSYKPLQSMGKQVLSTKTKNPEIPFGKAERSSLVKSGASDIGPADYKPPPAACEKQIDSRKLNNGSIKFGEGYRPNSDRLKKPNLVEPSPGPGSYKLPGGIATKAKGTPYRSSPAAILSGRTKFGSPW